MSILDDTPSPVERQALADFARRVRVRYRERLVKMAVFGSRARGDVHEESDIDVAVVLRGEVGFLERSDVSGMACDASLAAPEPVELWPRVLAEGEYRRLVDEEWRIGLDIEREGVAL